jgi:hypothetical protein
MAQREQIREDGQRITAGLPSLTSDKRREITERQLSIAYTRALTGIAREREEAALASDGSIDDVSDWEQIVGIALQGWQVCARLKKLNSNLWFERSNADPNILGIYRLKNDFKGGQAKEYLCGIQAELNSEFALRIKNDDGTPKGIIPGWRNALMRLIRTNVITEAGAFAMFGPPSRESENWARFAS